MEWIREVGDAKIDGEAKQEIHVFFDCFGTRHIVQLSLLTDEAPDVSLAQAMMDMELRAKDFADKLCSRGQDPQKFVKDGWGEIDLTDCVNCRK